MQRGLGDNDFAEDPRFAMERSATRNLRPARALSRQHLQRRCLAAQLASASSCHPKELRNHRTKIFSVLRNHE
jgi:hypothetical protein